MEGAPSDATLLAAVAERDIGALRALYERHAGWLALRLARRCNDHELVADAVQDMAAFALDEPANQVVDVTPTGPARGTGIRALALLAPIAAGAVLILAGWHRGLALPWAATGQSPPLRPEGP